MDIKDIVGMLDVWLSIFSVVGTFIIYKFIPYLQTKIITKKYYNTESSFILIMYELIGMTVLNIIAIVFAIIFGKSTWQRVLFREYMIAWLIIIIFYIAGIIWIVRYKAERGSAKYKKNIFYGFVICFIMFVAFLLIFINKYQKKYNWCVYFFIFYIVFKQGKYNVEIEKKRNIKYTVLTVHEECYDTLFKPVKQGKYFFISITDEQGKRIKMIQIPEDRIEKIEHIIEDI